MWKAGGVEVVQVQVVDLRDHLEEPVYQQLGRQDRQASLQDGLGVEAHQQEGPQALLERPRGYQESPLGGFGADAPRD